MQQKLSRSIIHMTRPFAHTDRKSYNPERGEHSSPDQTPHAYSLTTKHFAHLILADSHLVRLGSVRKLAFMRARMVSLAECWRLRTREALSTPRSRTRTVHPVARRYVPRRTFCTSKMKGPFVTLLCHNPCNGRESLPLLAFISSISSILLCSPSKSRKILDGVMH